MCTEGEAGADAISGMAGTPYESSMFKAHSEAGSVVHNAPAVYTGPAAGAATLNFTQQQPNGAATGVGYGGGGLGGQAMNVGPQAGVGPGMGQQQMQQTQQYGMQPAMQYGTQGQMLQQAPTGALNYGYSQQSHF